MPPLDRHLSFASDISTASVSSELSTLSTGSTTSTATTAAPESPVPAEVQTRKRPTPAQLNALQTAFDEKHYLSREERISLADGIGMELKAVTAWFQNRRQAAKRALTSKRAQQHAGQAASRRQNELRSTASLDHIASLSEKRAVLRAPLSGYMHSAPAPPISPPATPRRRKSAPGGARDSGSNDWSPHTPGDSSADIWQLMPSSPVMPPSSPAAERKRFAVLPPRSRSFRTLEFACAKARGAKTRLSEEEDQPSLARQHKRPRTETTSMEDEADSPLDYIPHELPSVKRAGTVDMSPSKIINDVDMEDDGKGSPCGSKSAMDVEAAMLLIGFKGERMPT